MLNLSSKLTNLISVGDTIDVRGPGGLLMYEGKGVFELKEDKKAAPKQVKVENVTEVLFKELLARQSK